MLPLPEPPKRLPYRRGGAYMRDPLQIGLTIVGVTAAFGGAGWWLDSRLGTFPILMALGAMAGLFGIIYLTYLQLKASDEADQPPDETRPPEGRA